jgi:hypothetical protein
MVTASASEAWAIGFEQTVNSLVRHMAPNLSERVFARVASDPALNDTHGAEYLQITLFVGECNAQTAAPGAP